MKKITLLLLSAVFLSGCASYKFQRGSEPYEKGYVVSRDGYAITEYTIGKEASVPGLALAKERFKKRRKTVEHYYKKMGYIENHFKAVFYDPAAIFAKVVLGIFRLPFIAISDYRYEHNPEYREKIRRQEQEKDAEEEARIDKLKEELDFYIQKDLAGEGS